MTVTEAPVAAETLSPRKQAIRAHAEHFAPERERWIERNAAYYAEDHRYMRFLVPPGLSVLDLGCGTGELLAALRPSRGVGIDFSATTIARAREKHPELEFHVGDVEDPALLAGLEGPFDIIILADTIGYLEDCEITLAALHPLCTPETRLVVAYHSHLWEPILKLAEHLGWRMPQPEHNFLSTLDIANLISLADFELIKREWRQLVPRRLFGIGTFINRYIATLPLVRLFCLRNYIVARPLVGAAPRSLSASVVIPCRNEKGNIEPAIRRMPRFAEDIEVIYVEGHSQDGTLEECQRVQQANPDWDIKVVVQDGKGKGDAVRKGFEMARGDVLMILDADLTMPPEMLPRFYNVLVRGRGEFVNGTRLVYPMERNAMRFLNYVANRSFAIVFSFLLNQRFTDTLCGTKVLSRSHYQDIAENRAYFGDFDPFGDFDLIFGAAKLNLKIIEIPIRYSDRMYGTTQIARFADGWRLIRMVEFAWRKLKAF